MITALLVTVLPTLLAYILLNKTGLKPHSKFLMIALSWFTGMYFFTFGTFLIAMLFTSFTTAVLLKATYAMLLLVQFCLMFYVKDVHHLLLRIKHKLRPLTRESVFAVLLAAFCLFFSYAFFAHHLTIQNEKIYTTPIYWDFHWHAALIQNFTLGDNIPPENEAFAGLPHTYHYFWGIVAGIYEVAGLNLAEAINAISILAFFFILLAIVGLCEELFHSRLVGFLAVILTLTSSSLHFIFYFASKQGLSPSEIISGIVTNTTHPWYQSFLPGNAFGYNGTMLNLFYFLEERQMIFGVVYLLLCVWILCKREQFSSKLLFFLGVAMGAYFLWHLHITIMVLCALLFLLVFGKAKKQTAILLGGFLILFIGHYLYFKTVMHSDWFYKDIAGFPRLNFGFGSGENEPFSFKDFIVYYVFSYGAKLIFIVLGLIMLFKKNKNIFLVLCSIIIPTFIILNTIQLSPSSIYENHKWFRPMNVLIDITTAFILFKLFFDRKKAYVKSFGIAWIFFLTISGIIELTPFLNSKPTDVYASYPSSITTAITDHTKPRTTFIGTDTREINLAGRKVFLGNNLGGDMRFKKDIRREIIENIYRTETLTDFCSLTKNYNIDFVEFDDDSYVPLKETALTFPHFKATNQNNMPVFFVDVKQACG